MKSRLTGEIAISILNSISFGVIHCDENGEIIYCNKTFLESRDLREEELLGRNILDCHMPVNKAKIRNILEEIKKGNRVDFEKMVNTRGRNFDHILCPVIDNDGKYRGLTLISYDVTEEAGIQEQLRAIARTDGLTGLYNRMHFKQVIEDTGKNFKYGSSVLLMMIDINGLKIINDMLGHGEGDFIIRKCSEILEKSVRKEDMVFRIGGDEFVIFMGNTDIEMGKAVVTRIREKCEEWNLIGEKPYGLYLSMGVASAVTAEQFKTLVHRADHAMYWDKKKFYADRDEIKHYGVLR